MEHAENFSPVAVTGGSGYIASWIVLKLLERGMEVHATVRNLSDEKKVGHLKSMQKNFPGQLSLFEADLNTEGSFDAAVANCEALIHSASPFVISNIKDPELELIRPAKVGTENVLRSADRAQTVRKVVLTSSVAAIHTDNNEWKNTSEGILNENHWNSTASAKYQPYSYSKTLAEKAAWEYAQQQDHWDLAVINPSFVVGPSLSKRLDGTSSSTVAGFFTGQFKQGIPDLHFGMVDVRDVAEAHILALEHPEAKGRFILMSEEKSLPEAGKVLQNMQGGRLPVNPRVLPKAMFYVMGPFLGFSWRYTRNNYGVPVKLDAARSRDILRLKYRTIADSLVDHAEQLLKDGLVSV